MFFVSHIPYHFWERFAVIGYVISLILIVLVLSPLGVEVNGARRWLNLGMSIQPAEIAKLAVVIYFADSISKKKDRMQTFRYASPLCGAADCLAALVGIEPHLSGAILIMGAAR